ncbi:MAG: lipocalin-like domain-containing protein [bacterium]|nr:lipocalin-like domain-containing protein [bacterium]
MPTLSERILGCWRLVSYEFKGPAGPVPHPWGKDPVGIAIIDKSGYMSVQIMRRDRPLLAGKTSTPETIKAAFQGYTAYFGPYQANEKDGTFTTRVEGAVIPDWVGGEQFRYAEVSDTQIVFRTPPIRMGKIEAVGRLVWEKISPKS